MPDCRVENNRFVERRASFVATHLAGACWSHSNKEAAQITSRRKPTDGLCLRMRPSHVDVSFREEICWVWRSRLEVPENGGKWKAAAAKSILRLLMAPCQGSMDQNLQALFVGLKKTLRNHNNLKQRWMWRSQCPLFISINEVPMCKFFCPRCWVSKDLPFQSWLHPKKCQESSKVKAELHPKN